jgi:hypothetical protein
MEQVENAARRLPRDKAEAWKKKHGKALKPLAKEAERESARVESLPEVYAVLRASPLFEARRRHMETVARSGVALLEMAVRAYHDAKGSYPADLSALVKAGYYEGEDLKDPWDRPYVYDPKAVHPKSGVPLIYSQGVNPTDPKGRISNFVPGKEKPGK